MQRIREIQERFLRKLLQSKAGKVLTAFNKLKDLPDRGNDEKRIRANKFEKGLSTFVDRTMRRPLNAFKT